MAGLLVPFALDWNIRSESGHARIAPASARRTSMACALRLCLARVTPLAQNVSGSKLWRWKNRFDGKKEHLAVWCRADLA